MRGWDLTLSLDPGGGAPLFLQIARGITDRIRDGRLRPGAALPGSRTLARALGVNRNTVLSAYDQLLAEGWATSAPTRGTFVAADLPHRAVPAPPSPWPSAPASPGYALGAAPAGAAPPLYPSGALVLARAAPDLRLFPAALVLSAYRRAALRNGRELLGLGDPQGHPRLRAALATMLADNRGLPISPDALLVTRGSQMGLDLVARALIAPGDVVVVEELGHPAAWNAFRQAGARLVPVPVDRAGLVVDALEQLQTVAPIRLIYFTPHHQFPTTAVMPAARRVQLLELATRHRIALLEDDYDHEFHYAGRPLLPVASADRAGVVIYLGTLSKLLAQGIRVGFVAGPPGLIARLTQLRVATDLQGDRVLEAALADLFEADEIGRHARRVRRIYRARRDALAASLTSHLGGILEFTVPAGGMALWARVAPQVDLAGWSARAERAGVCFRGAGMYHFRQAPIPYTRLAFSAHDEAELDQAVRRMAEQLAMTTGSGARRVPAGRMRPSPAPRGPGP